MDQRIATAGAGARVFTCMNDQDQPHDEKKVTAATTDAPLEEFISPEPPSKPDPNAGQKSGGEAEPPRH